MAAPTKTIPPDYSLTYKLDLSSNLKMMLALNVIGLALFFLFGWVFLRLAAALRQEGQAVSWDIGLGDAFSLVAGYALVLILHELVHGLVFWIFTRERPRFGLRQLYAFAAAPDWYIPRNPYLVVGLAPLVVITLAGIAILPFLPAEWVLLVIFMMTANASGAVGDIFTVGWLLRRPASAMVRDQGDIFNVYLPEVVK